MKKLFHTVILLSVLSSSLLYAGEDLSVIADNVNLRAAPTNTAEVVSQVSSGHVLSASGRIEGDWREVVPPESVDLWVYGEFVVKGEAVVSKLQVRAGPGINYTVLGKLEKGERVVSRGTKGEWLKIAPPRNCMVWVSRDYVKPIVKEKKQPPKKVPTAQKKPGPEKPVKLPPAPAQIVSQTVPLGGNDEIPESLKDVELATDVSQGLTIERTGVIDHEGMAWKSQRKCRLVTYDRWNWPQPICYIYGDEQYLASIDGKTVVLRGRQYWLKGGQYPVVIPDQIILGQ